MSAGADFSLAGRVAIITGGAGLLGVRHGEAIAAAGGVAILADVRGAEAEARAAEIAANNPKVEAPGQAFSRLENFPLEQWDADLAVGLTGPFLCAKIVGGALARQRRGVIVNISSEYGVIAPDQRLYLKPGVPPDQQPVKPVTYTVAKAGLHGLTIYLATYWADAGVRVNTITLGGVESGQPAGFRERATQRIPLGRMAQPHDFQGALVYLCSDAAAFVTGANLVVDGGKTIW